MSGENSTQWFCNQIFEIFKTYNLTTVEIEHLLSGTGPAPTTNENFNEASCEIADLFLNENVSIIQASTVFKECYELFSLKNNDL